MRARIWKIDGREIDLAREAMIMGVLNVTPDSFSDGGLFFAPQKAIDHARGMIAQGAQIIDVGGESTRPGAESISPEEERRRVLPVVEALRPQTRAVFISIDTSKPAIAQAALEAGAAIVNDVTGGRSDEMCKLVAERRCALIIMHMQGAPPTMQLRPRYNDVVAEVGLFFRQQLERAIGFGIDPMSIAFDPGIGFGKTLEHNVELLRNLERLRVHDRPMVLGVSRKGFLGTMIQSGNMDDRLAATVALTALLRERGADVLRVHDVKQNVAALRMAEALLTAP
ncbi:MAG TPA: dihydropteroate synthase [Chthoniobacterales bacterium]|jgi:dihydropteroate synthase|nr:dihydropteroate synthase [Chthoniobacterales bacterium]